MRRLRMSRPTSSVPSRCADDGAALISPDCFVGSYGATSGATTATRMTSTTNARPVMATRSLRNRRHSSRQGPAACDSSTGPVSERRAPSSMMAVVSGPGPSVLLTWPASLETHLRVQERVHDVDEQVHHDEGQREDEDHALDHGQVLLHDRVQGVLAEAVDGEDALHDERAAEQVRDLDSQDRGGGDGRVLQCVLPDDRASREAVGTRGADVVLVEHVDERAAQLA